MPWLPPGRRGTPTSPPTAPGPRRLTGSPPDFSSSRIKADGRGEPCAALRTIEYLDAHHGQPRPSSHQPDYTLLAPSPYGYAGTDDGRGTGQRACAKRLTLMSGRGDGLAAGEWVRERLGW